VDRHHPSPGKDGSPVGTLRTNCHETDPALIWKWYIQLIAAEAAFRTAKSDLGLRPVYHQTESRMEARILVCFLALALWRSLEQWMASKGMGTCAPLSF
jgi:transposase